MRTLIYKRTHSGDPDELGRFGIHDCMGEVRGLEYAAVIGIGGVGAEPRRKGIAEKLTWVGIGPHKSPGSPRGPLVTFDHYLYFGEKGQPLVTLAPSLAARFYRRHGPRYLLKTSEMEQREVDAILALARTAPPSRALADDEDEREDARCARPPKPGAPRVRQRRC